MKRVLAALGSAVSSRCGHAAGPIDRNQGWSRVPRTVRHRKTFCVSVVM